MDSIAPTLNGIFVQDTEPGFIQIKVLCPHCGRYHYHGWDLSNDKNTVEPRSSDCDGDGYYIKFSPDDR